MICQILLMPLKDRLLFYPLQLLCSNCTKHVKYEDPNAYGMSLNRSTSPGIVVGSMTVNVILRDTNFSAMLINTYKC